MIKTARKERRIAQRIELTASIRYATYHSDFDKTLLTPGSTVNASHTGLQVSVSSAVEVPAYVHIALRLPDRTAPAVLLGKTVWCRADPEGGYRAGIQFLGHIDPAFRKYLEDIRS